jgi:hypothetical protein
MIFRETISIKLPTSGNAQAVLSELSAANLHILLQLTAVGGVSVGGASVGGASVGGASVGGASHVRSRYNKCPPLVAGQ